MQIAPAPQAIIFIAGWTAVLALTLIELKDGIAARSGAPARTFLFFLNVIVEGKLLVLLFEIFGKKLIDIILQYFCSASFLRTGEGNLFADDLFLCVLSEALPVEQVTTAEMADL